MGRAFTLIELLIVVAIIAILALIAVPNFLEASTRAKVARVENDLRNIALALEAYCVDWNDYPETSDESILAIHRYGGFIRLTTPVAFLTSVPFDPFNRERGDDWSRRRPLTYEMGSTGCTDLSPKGWAVYSSGPDRHDDTGPGNPLYPHETLTTTIYDPTNGTVSKGDVIRFGPRIFLEKIRFR